MSSIFDKLVGRQLITDYPSFMKNNIHYEALVGSVAYGVSGDASDVDVYGFCMPPKHILFPYQSGHILGFGKQPESFNQFQKHHIKDVDHKKEYDISIYNIVRFFQLCMESNPNMVDALFVPQNCILSSTQIGGFVRENRKVFLSKLCWHKFKGYAYSQLSKMNDKAAKEFVDLCHDKNWDLGITLEDALKDTVSLNRDYVKSIFKRVDQSGKRTKRLVTIQKYGYDVKFAYNVVRLLEEVHQILEEGDLDLQRSKEMLKSIRRGEWDISEINQYFDRRIKVLETAYEKSKLPHSPREEEIKKILMECISYHYGDDIFTKSVKMDTSVKHDILKVKDIVDSILKSIE